MTTQAAQAKSGLKNLKPGDVLFNDGEQADSLFIIQKGQVRLYKPKGKGFIELAVLRSGEVIGEMAYFDEEGGGKKRSCSASAITPVEVIEISFAAFGKTMQSLNPWFKTIIHTLVARLKKTNTRVKELENNQASISYGGKAAGYEFLKPIEVMRILGTFFLVFKAHGDVKDHSLAINRKVLNLYTQDMYQIMEVKLETIMSLLITMGWMEVRDDEDQLPNLILLSNIEQLRQIFIFYNSERHLPEDKKLRVGDKCEMMIAKMIANVTKTPLLDIPNIKNTEDAPAKFTKFYDITKILEDFKSQNILVHADHLSDGRNIGLFGEVMVQEGKSLVEIDFPKVQKMYPVIRFMNAIKKSNQEKDPASGN